MVSSGAGSGTPVAIALSSKTMPMPNARCAGATFTFSVDFTGFSRLQASTAPSRLNVPRAGRRIRFRSAPGPRLAGRSDRVVTAAEE
jgi:hypothetical protein